MSVGQFCKKNVVVIDKTESLTKAAYEMAHHHIGSLVVVEKIDSYRRPIGIITDRDLAVKGMARLDHPGGHLIEDIMQTSPVTVRDSDSLYEVALIMKKYGVRRLPVVNGNENLVGMISADDIIRILAEEMMSLSQIPEVQVGIEEKKFD